MGASGQVQDIVTLRNGDAVTGEVLRLSRGNLEFDTDAMNVVFIDWDDVASIASSLVFEVTDVTGRQFYGSLSPGARDRVLVVGFGPDDDEAVSLPYAVVVDIRNLAEGFFAKTNGYLDLGINVAQANDLKSVLFNGHVGYNGLIWEIDLDAESYLQSQTTATGESEGLAEQTTRNSAAVTGRRFFSADWAATTSAEIEENEELNLDRRVLLSLGGRYNIIRNQGLDLYAGLNGVFNSEQFQGESASESGEINLTAGFDMFDVGRLDIYTQVDGYATPGEDRFRLNFNGRASWEIVDDFFIGLTAVERYDSSPAGNATKRDFQFGFTIGWSWG